MVVFKKTILILRHKGMQKAREKTCDFAFSENNASATPHCE
jgi:hypothetical protein